METDYYDVMVTCKRSSQKKKKKKRAKERVLMFVLNMNMMILYTLKKNHAHWHHVPEQVPTFQRSMLRPFTDTESTLC